MELLYTIVFLLVNGDEMRVGQFKGEEACKQAIPIHIEQVKKQMDMEVKGAYCEVKK